MELGFVLAGVIIGLVIGEFRHRKYVHIDDLEACEDCLNTYPCKRNQQEVCIDGEYINGRVWCVGCGDCEEEKDV